MKREIHYLSDKVRYPTEEEFKEMSVELIHLFLLFAGTIDNLSFPLLIAQKYAQDYLSLQYNISAAFGIKTHPKC